MVCFLIFLKIMVSQDIMFLLLFFWLSFLVYNLKFKFKNDNFERIKMLKRGGELDFSKYLSNL